MESARYSSLLQYSNDRSNHTAVPKYSDPNGRTILNIEIPRTTYLPLWPQQQRHTTVVCRLPTVHPRWSANTLPIFSHFFIGRVGARAGRNGEKKYKLTSKDRNPSFTWYDTITWDGLTLANQKPAQSQAASTETTSQTWDRPPTPGRLSAGHGGSLS
jgi:hypothetical protein